MARLVYGLLCDQIRVEAGTNKHILIGVFDRFNVEDFTQPLPPFMVFGRVVFDEFEKGYALDIEIAPLDGDPVATLAGAVTIKPNPGDQAESIYAGVPNFYLNFMIQGLKVPRPGHYMVVVKVDGEAVGRIEFYARQKTDEEKTATASPSVQPPPS